MTPKSSKHWHCPKCGRKYIAADRISYYDIAAACGVSHRTVVRWMKAGSIPDQMTDRVATHLGWHPAAIWGADWYISTALKEAA